MLYVKYYFISSSGLPQSRAIPISFQITLQDSWLSFSEPSCTYTEEVRQRRTRSVFFIL